jgi:hypothetical protein
MLELDSMIRALDFIGNSVLARLRRAKTLFPTLETLFPIKFIEPRFSAVMLGCATLHPTYRKTWQAGGQAALNPCRIQPCNTMI